MLHFSTKGFKKTMVFVRRRERLDFSSRIAIFAIGFVLIFSEVCLFSSGEKIKSDGSRWSPARKARFIGSGHHVSSNSRIPSHFMSLQRNYDQKSSKETEKTEDNELFDEDKRLVHTGPNPLHN